MTIILRRNAEASGLKKYFTGKPCKRGHISERHVITRACIICLATNTKAWNANNPDRATSNRKAWRSANPERTLELSRSWRKSNPEKTRELRKNGRVKIRSTPTGFMNHKMGTSMGYALHGQKSGLAWESLVSYTVKQLVSHIERQFLKGMGWHNRKLWHIDHIIPLSSYIFTSYNDQDFQAAWALSNLRPIWAKDNWSKSNKREWLL